MSGRRWDGGEIESEEEAGVGLMSGVHVAIHEEEDEESPFGGRGISGCGVSPGGCGGGGGGGCAGPSSSSSSACCQNNRTSGAKHVLVWNQPELDELTAADNHNGYSHRPVPAKGIHNTLNARHLSSHHVVCNMCVLFAPLHFDVYT